MLLKLKYSPLLVLHIILFILFSHNVLFSEVMNYTYDNMHHVIRAEYEDGTVVEYVYDNLGNRLQKTTTLTGAPANTPPNAASNPGILAGATGVSTTPSLSWTGGSDPDTGDEVAFYLYFGTPGNLSLISSGWQTSYDPGQLESLTEYCWKVVSRDSHNADRESPIWCFTTKNDPPQASFITNITEGLVPLTINFSDTSVSPDDEIVSYAWDFDNDGTIDAEEPNPAYTYDTPGTYTVRLTVTDIHGTSGTKTKENLILADTDPDQDRIFTTSDNCPENYNPDQTDMDEDGAGDVCDPDIDGDDIDNDADNCPLIANSAQADADDDGYGDACTVIHCVSSSADFQEALNTAQWNGMNDVIQLVQGTYGISDNDERNFSYSSSEPYSLIVRGGYAPSCNSREADPSNTILDGESLDTVLFFNLRDFSPYSDLVIEGVTVENAQGDYESGISVSFNGSGNIVLSNNIITNNVSERYAGGININASNGKTTLANNVITNNSSNRSAAGIKLYSDYGNTFLTNNIIAANHSENDGGGIYLSSQFGTSVLTNNIIHSNSSKDEGGGIYIYSREGNTSLINNSVIGNIVTDDRGKGGGIYVYPGARLNLYNNIIRDNTASAGSDIRISTWDDAAVSVYNNNFDPEKILGSFTNEGNNINAAPLFADPANGDYHLTAASPCIDTGNNDAPDLPLTDFENEGRIADGNNDGEAVADIGADEYWRKNLSVSPVSHNFVQVKPGNESVPQTLNISNSSDNNIGIETISLTGENISEFSIRNDSCSGQTLSPSANCTVDAVFAPISSGIKTASLTIVSDDPESSALNVSLSGTGYDADAPAILEFHGGSNHSGCQGCQDEYTVSFHGVIISDPQGPDTIASVIVNAPDGSLYATLSDDGEHCDEEPGDGIYGSCGIGNPSQPELGNYTLVVTDNDGNTDTKTVSVERVLDIPRNPSPNNISVETPIPTFTWSPVDEAVTYHLEVKTPDRDRMWWRGDLNKTSAEYNDDGTGQDLIQGDVYYWGVGACDNDDNCSWYHTNIKFSYFREKPFIVDGYGGSSHSGGEGGEDEYTVNFEVSVSDPQGLDTIASVIVNAPDGSLYQTLSDDGEHCDEEPGDGIYGSCAPGISQIPPIGDYTIIVTDTDGNTDTGIITVDRILDIPRNPSPSGGNFVDTPTPVLTWNPVDGAVTYHLDVRNSDGEQVWWRNDISGTSVSYNDDGTGQDLLEGGVYRWGIGACDNEDNCSWHHIWIEFVYSSTDKPFITEGYGGSMHSGGEGGDDEYAVHFWGVKANDPQGRDTIVSLAVNAPDGSFYAKLSDDGESCDESPEDGIYGWCGNSISTPPLLGDYTIVVTDEDGNTDTQTISVERILDIPRNPSPGGGTLIGSPLPTLIWESVDEAVTYHLEVRNADWDMMWWREDIDGTSVSYNDDGTGQELVEGDIYHWGVGACDNDDNCSWHHTWIEFIYSSDNPFISEAHGGSRHSGGDGGDDEYAVHFWGVKVNDPQGAETIASVVVNAPDGSVYATLSDDGKNCDDDFGDGIYGWCGNSISTLPLVGDYAIIATDEDGNTDIRTISVEGILELPRNPSPGGGILITTPTPTFSWNPVDGAVKYNLEVRDADGNFMWKQDDIETTSVNYNDDNTGRNLTEGIYYWGIGACDEQDNCSWHHTWIQFIYSTSSGMISGRITTKEGQPITAVCVNALATDSWNWVGGSVTDTNGNYAIVIPSGNYYICTDISCGGNNEPQNYVDTCWNSNGNETAPIAVGSGGSISDINLSLSESGTISGTVTDGVTGNAPEVINTGSIDLDIGWHKFVYRQEGKDGYSMISRAAFKAPGDADWRWFSASELQMKISPEPDAENGIFLVNKKSAWDYHPRNHEEMVACVDTDSTEAPGWYGQSIVNIVHQDENIHGRDDQYTSYYESYFYVDKPGKWFFSSDSDDASEIVIDDQVVAAYYGGHYGVSIGIWEYRGRVSFNLLDSDGNSSEWFDTPVKADGSYRKVGLPPGEYIVYAHVPGYIKEFFEDVYNWNEASPVIVNPSEEVRDINFTLEPGFPIEGSIMNVYESDGSFRTYIGIYISDEFNGTLPDDIDSITITDSNGETLFTKDDLVYDPPQDFFASVPGSPGIGKYTFTVTSGSTSVTVNDVQNVIRTIPIPDESTFSPKDGETVISKTPTFIWQSIDYNESDIYYRLTINDLQDNRVFATNRKQNLASCIIPKGILEPGKTYKWRIRITDSSDWIGTQNRSNSEWLTFTMADPLTPDLADVIIILQLISGYYPDNVHLISDINGDEEIGIEEAIYALQIVSDLF
jgi:YD repeat-containing protein